MDESKITKILVLVNWQKNDIMNKIEKEGNRANFLEMVSNSISIG